MSARGASGHGEACRRGVRVRRAVSPLGRAVAGWPALAVLALALSACCRAGSCRAPGARRTGPPLGLDAGATSAPSGAGPHAQVEPLAPGPDGPPAHYTTLAESAAKRPSWWALRRARDAPDSPSREALEAALAPAAPGAQRLAFVACVVSYAKGTDVVPLNEGADLYGTLRLGARTHSFSGGWFSVPLSSIALGERVSVTANDSDLLFDDALGSVSTTYQGKVPFEAKSGPLSLRCGVLEPARFEPLVASHLRAADLAIEKAIEGLRFDREQWDWGAKLSGLPRAEDAVDEVAALVGFADPRVLRRVDWLERARAHLDRQAIPVVEALRARATTEVTVGAAELGAVSLDRLTCDPREVDAWLRKSPAHAARVPPVRCLVRVRLTAGTREWKPPFSLLHAAALRARGGIQLLEVGPLEGATGGSVFPRIEPGKTATQVLVTTSDLSTAGDEAVVLRVVHDGVRHYLRLR